MSAADVFYLIGLVASGAMERT